MSYLVEELYSLEKSCFGGWDLGERDERKLKIEGPWRDRELKLQESLP